MAEIIKLGADRSMDFDRETVRQVERLLYGSEWKRYQAAPGPRVSPRSFWLDRRYPLVNRWRDPAGG